MAIGPFERYQVTGSVVRGAADRLTGYAGNVETLRFDVASTHRVAQQNVAGLLASPMVAAAEPVRQRTQRWLQSAVFSGAAVRLFGDVVDEYNRAVDSLNERYWEAKRRDFGLTMATLPAEATEAERSAARADFAQRVRSADAALLAELRHELHTVHRPKLDDGAHRVASLLDRGPDDAEAVIELYAAGALPWTAPLLFRQVDFSQVVPPVSAADGEWAADVIRRALAGDASPEEFEQAMRMLLAVTDRAAQVAEDGGYLTAEEIGFLHNFYNGLGDKLWEVPDYIARDRHVWDNPWWTPFDWLAKRADGFDADTQEWMMGALGAGVVTLSNPQYWPPSLRGEDPLDTDSTYHLPETVIDLISGPQVTARDIVIGGYPYLEIKVERMGDFDALARMFAGVDERLEAGTRFSELTTLRVAEIAAATMVLENSGVNSPGLLVLSDQLHDVARVSGTLEDLLGVSTRNAEANYHLLTSERLDPMARIGNHLSHVNYVLDDRQFLLTALYGFEWSDEGAAVAGLTDWIAEHAHQAAMRDEQDPMANEAAAALIDLVTMTERGEGHNDPDDYRFNMYDTLMRTLAEQNPEVARSFSRVAASYLDDFSEPSGSRTTVESDGSLSLSDHDKIRFLDLIATDESAINGLSFAAGEYQERILVAGLSGEMSMHEIGQRSSTLDGLLAAARVNADLVGGSQRYESAQAAYEEHMRYASYAKTAGTTLAGLGIDASPFKPAGPWLKAGLGHLADEIIKGAIEAPSRDIGFETNILDQGYDNTYASYAYLDAMIEAGQVTTADVPRELLRTYYVYYPHVEMPVLVDGKPVLKPVSELDGGERQLLINLVGSELNGIGGSQFQAFRQDYDASVDFLRAYARDAEAHRLGLR